MIIDAEVHLIQPNRHKKSSLKKFDEYVMEYYFHNHPEGDYALKLAQCDELLKSMVDSKIDKSIIMGLPWRSSFLCAENNKYIYDCCKRYPDKFYGFGLINYQDLKFSYKEIKKMKYDYGFYGVKVIPSWQDFKLSYLDFSDLLNEMEKLDLILLPHIDFMYQSPIEYQGPHLLYSLAEFHPNLKILAPHLGGLLCLHQLHKPIKKILKNVRFITSVSTTMKFVEFASQCCEEHQLVFGTDYPFQPNHDQKTLLNQFNKLKIPKSLKTKILSENILNFLNIKP